MIKRCLKQLLLGLICLTCVLSFAQTPLSPEAQEVLQKGGQAAALALATYDEHFIDKPLWREAVNYGLELQRLAPDNPQTYRFLGQVYSSISFYSRAWEAWEKYKSLGGVMNAQTAPYLASVSSWLGSKSFVEEKYQDALTYYGALLELEPDSEEANQHLALSHIALGEPAKATPYLSTLTEAYPNKVDYVNLLSRTEEQASYGIEATQAFYNGIDLYSQGNKQKALESFEQAASLSTSYRKAFVWAGRVNQELAQPGRAIPYWQRAITLNENDEEALKALEQAEGQDRFGSEAYNSFQQGLSYYQKGSRGEAFWSFQRATQLNPNYAEAYAWLGQISVENRDLNAALGFYSRAQQLEPNNRLIQSAYSETARLVSQIAVNQAQATATQAQTPPANTTPATTTTTTSPQTATETATPTETASAATTTNPPKPEPVAEQPNQTQPTQTAVEPTPQVVVEDPPVKVDIQPTATVEPPAPIEPVPVASLPTPAPIEPVSPGLSASTADAPKLDPTPAPSPEIVASTAPEPPKPEPQPQAAGGPAVTVLDVNYEHTNSDNGGTGGFSFFDGPSSLLSNLKSPVDYADGKLYQRINVSSKPSGEPVRYQICLVHNDSLSIGPACSTTNTLQFEEPGVYEVSQPLSTFTHFNEIDWTKGIQQVMLILQDKDGNTLDNRVAYAGAEGASVNLEAFYPMKVKYSAILVPLGGTFPGWP